MDNNTFEMEDLNDAQINDDDEDAQTETRINDSFSPTRPGEKVPLLIRENLDLTIDDLYNHIGIERDRQVLNSGRFKLMSGKKGTILLFLKNNGVWESLTTEDGDFKADSSIYTILGSEKGMKKALGIDELPEHFKQYTSSAKKAAAKDLNDSMPSLTEVDGIPLKKLPKAVRNIENQLSRSSGDLLPMRELLGLDKALRTIRGALENNLGKLDELDHLIAERERELENLNPSQFGGDEARFETVKNATERDIETFKEDRKARLEVLSGHRKELRSQLSRIKETIYKVLNEDATLAEKIRTIFREQGVTIAAIVSAFGLLISTLVGFLTVGAAGGYTPPSSPPSTPEKLRRWLKKQLKNLARLLGKLAEKFGAALPGIIGSIVSWLFTLLKKTVGFLAENLWVLLLFVAGSILAYMKR